MSVLTFGHVLLFFVCWQSSVYSLLSEEAIHSFCLYPAWLHIPYGIPLIGIAFSFRDIKQATF